MPTTFTFPLLGPGGEPIDPRRTMASHGVADLPPMRVDTAAWALEATLALPGLGVRTLHIRAGAAGFAAVTLAGALPDGEAAARAAVLTAVRHLPRLDEDLSSFYAAIAADSDLAWATGGAGRMIRGATVFEDVVKTICTTNRAWSATVRMVHALVAHLGEPAPDASPSGAAGRAFPTPAAMTAAGAGFYRDVVRAGYRGRYLLALAEAVAAGQIDLEALGRATPAELPDDELAKRRLALPGVGPYAAAHIMMMSLGRYSRLILDSWTRPTYARLAGHDGLVADAGIVERFRRYGEYAGLAFWLYLTRHWVPAGDESRVKEDGAA